MRRTHKENIVQENKKNLNEKALIGPNLRAWKELVRRDRPAENRIYGGTPSCHCTIFAQSDTKEETIVRIRATDTRWTAV